MRAQDHPAAWQTGIVASSCLPTSSEILRRNVASGICRYVLDHHEKYNPLEPLNVNHTAYAVPEYLNTINS